ncbi:MAG: DoxX family membrane protein [Candidatus Aminicenantes bacterium]|nr:DoxX family membrane protein [Candidatus Aminicenantes bacterium]
MFKTRKPSKDKTVILTCRIILGSVFIFASIDKIFHPEAFAGILHNYKLLPDILIYLPALFLPWIELIAGSFLIAGIFVRGSTFILSSLLLIFILAITINLIRGINFDCGCFSIIPGENGSTYFLLIRDLFLLIPGVLIYLYYKKDRR